MPARSGPVPSRSLIGPGPRVKGCQDRHQRVSQSIKRCADRRGCAPRHDSKRSRSVGWAKGVVNRRGGCYWPGAPVDAFAEQVGVPIVAGVLLDHVHEQLAQRDRLALGVAADRRASCPAPSPSHLSCSVSRWQRKDSFSVARSSPSRGPPSRGSEPGSRNVSARCCGVVTPSETTGWPPVIARP
jgi:hypothetical protein